MGDWEAAMEEELALGLDVHLVVEPQLLVDVGRDFGHPRWHLGTDKRSLLCNTR